MKNNRHDEYEDTQNTSRDNLLKKYGIEINKKPSVEKYHPYEKRKPIREETRYESDDYDEYDEPKYESKPLKRRKEHVETLLQSDSETDELDEPRKISSRRTKNKLDADGVNLINNLVKFCPKHSDEEAIWQHIKKCITIPPVQLYTKSAVMNYMKRQGHLR